MSDQVINQFWAIHSRPATYSNSREAAEAAQRLAELIPGEVFFVMCLQDAYCASVEVSPLPIEGPLPTECPLPDAVPEAETNGWIKWDGGECPVTGETLVAAECRDGGITGGRVAAGYRWTHNGWEGDIIAYKVVAS